MKKIIPIDALGVPLCVLLVASAAAADCGSIPFEPGVQVFEPNQRALIAWNGKEEILILSTDLRASKPTKVLEVIPLPSEPTVKQDDVAVIGKAVDLINDHLYAEALLRDRRHQTNSLGVSGGGRGPRPMPAGKVTFHEQIGATDVSVMRVLSRKGFVAWVEKYLKSLKVKTPKIPEPLKRVVAEYLADGYTWFVFNVVSLGKDTRTKQALQYRFKSTCIYYPLRITRTEVGNTAIKLLILSDGLIGPSTFTGIPRSRVRVAHAPIRLARPQLKRLHPDSWKLMGRLAAARLRIWEIKGKLSDFRQDLLAGGPRAFYLRNDTTRRFHGPFLYEDDAKVVIDGEAYRLKPTRSADGDAAWLFSLEHARSRKRHGPFSCLNGAGIVIGRRVYSLSWRKPSSRKVLMRL